MLFSPALRKQVDLFEFSFIYIESSRQDRYTDGEKQSETVRGKKKKLTMRVTF